MSKCLNSITSFSGLIIFKQLLFAPYWLSELFTLENAFPIHSYICLVLNFLVNYDTSLIRLPNNIQEETYLYVV